MDRISVFPYPRLTPLQTKFRKYVRDLLFQDQPLETYLAKYRENPVDDDEDEEDEEEQKSASEPEFDLESSKVILS